MNTINDTKKLIQYSIDNDLAHMPSALSQYSYLKYLLPLFNYDKINIVIGKPFGAQAYYLIWKDIGLILPDQVLSYGVKHSELDFVSYGEETLGNALGIASGIAIASDKKTYVNLSDGAMQMGPTLEAIQFIGANQQNILVTIDCNGQQLTGSTYDILGQTILNHQNTFNNNHFKTFIITENDLNIDYLIYLLSLTGPVCILFKTYKGQGVVEMKNDPVGYHYKKLRNIDEITFS